MKINKLGLIFALINVALVFGIAGIDGLLLNFTMGSANAPSEMRFLTWMMVINFLPFLALAPAIKIPLLTGLYFKTYWMTCFHFALLGGIQWYLIGWGISALWRRKKRG